MNALIKKYIKRITDNKFELFIRLSSSAKT